jgi:hypothetical protein
MTVSALANPTLAGKIPPPPLSKGGLGEFESYFLHKIQDGQTLKFLVLDFPFAFRPAGFGF